MGRPLSERLSAELVHANRAGDTDLADLLREAADMARRVEGAEVGRVVVPFGDGPDFAIANDKAMTFVNARPLRNHLVRLVPEAG